MLLMRGRVTRPLREEPELEYLNNCRSFYSCICCRTHLADHDQLISRTFHGSHGRACLFKSVVNVKHGVTVERDLITGSHLVSDISCSRCSTVIGWKYEKAQSESQKYKEGKYVIELAHVIRENRHLELDNGDKFFGNPNYYKSASSCQSTPAKIGLYHCGASKFCDEHQTDMEIDSRNTQLLPVARSSNEACSERGANNDGGVLRNNNKSQPLAINNPRQQSGRRMSNSDLRSTTQIGNPTVGSVTSTTGTPEFDEDLLFVFYDDWCASKSNYPSSLSWSHYNRKRRSLYKNSKPYDWKFQSNSVSPTESSCISPSSSASIAGTSASSTCVSPFRHNDLQHQDCFQVDDERKNCKPTDRLADDCSPESSSCNSNRVAKRHKQSPSRGSEENKDREGDRDGEILC